MKKFHGHVYLRALAGGGPSGQPIRDASLPWVTALDVREGWRSRQGAMIRR